MSIEGREEKKDKKPNGRSRESHQRGVLRVERSEGARKEGGRKGKKKKREVERKQIKWKRQKRIN